MTLPMSKWVCYAIGYVFIISGITKLVVNDFRVIFTNLGFPYPELMLFFVAIIEVACGALVAARIYMKQAVPPLLLIMLGAIFLTKLPILTNGGFLSFAFEARLDIVIVILLFTIWKYR